MSKILIYSLAGLLIIGISISAWFMISSSSSSSSSPSSINKTSQIKKPNILFIMTDDQDLDTLKYMPNLQKYMVKEGVTFSKYFDNYALCCVARASILRGQYPNNSQIKSNVLPNGGFEKFLALGEDGEKQTIAVWLKNWGYNTVFIGKYLNGYGDRDKTSKEHIPPGWDQWFASFKQHVFNYEMNENGKIISYGQDEKDFKTDVIAGHTIEYLKNRKVGDTPFFIHLSPLAPHLPATPAPRHEGMFKDLQVPRTESFNEVDVSDKPQWVRELPILNSKQIEQLDIEYRNRLGSIQAVDDMIGEIFKTLEETGELDNTYIFFTTDNGYHLGQHRLRSGKQTIYEEDIRLPFIVRGPGISKNTVIDNIVGNIDLAATFAEIAGGAPMSVETDGRSFAGIMSTNFPKPDTWRNGYLIGFEVSDLLPKNNTGSNNSEDPDFLLETIPVRGNKKAYSGVRTENYMYAEYGNGDKELYDLRKDPLQLNSMDKTASPALLASLQAMLAKLRVCAGESCHTAEEMSINE
jgi:N-acetylglucosamine-6-sulfatase